MILLALLIGGTFVAIVVTVALRRLLGDMLPAPSASAVIIGVGVRLTDRFDDSLSLAITRANRRRAP